MTDRLTVAGAYAKIESHEDLCAIRYAAIEATLKELKANGDSHSRLLWGVLLSICGFLAVTLVAIVLHALKLA